MNNLKRYFLASLFAPAILLTGCRHENTLEEVPVAEGEIVLHIDRKEVTAARGVAEIRISIDRFDALKSLRVVKSTSYGNLPVSYQRAAIGAEFTYSYIVKQTDPERIKLEFTGYDTGGRASETVKVEVVNPKEAARKPLSAVNLKCVSRVTGHEDNGHDGLPAVQYTVNNQTDLKYNVGGCDLGIGWEIKPGYYGFFFGDTFGRDFRPNFQSPGPNGGSWRSNVLLFSRDMALSDGLVIDGRGRELEPGDRNGIRRGKQLRTSRLLQSRRYRLYDRHQDRPRRRAVFHLHTPTGQVGPAVRILHPPALHEGYDPLFPHVHVAAVQHLSDVRRIERYLIITLNK